MCTTTHQEAMVAGDGSSSSTCSYTVRVKARGGVVFVSLTSPVIAELQACITTAFGLLSSSTNKDMSLSYLHPGGGKAFLDDDADLSLALTHWRSCPALTVTAVFAEDNTDSPSPESIGGLYHEAAEHLRTYHGVTSITPVSLRRVVALLNLPMRRLVTQGLAPHWLPKDTQSPPLPQQQTETTMTLSAQYDNADLMSEHEYVSDNESEDGEDLDDEEVVEEVEDDRSAAAVATAAEDLPVGHDQQDESTTASETPDGGATQVQQTSLAPGAGNISREIAAAASNTTTTNRNNITETSPLHAALVAGGVTIHPYETDALIHALGVDPQRLVRLGLVNQEIVHAIPATATVRAKTRRSLGRPVGARKPKKVRVPVRVAGSKRRGPRGSTDGICAMGTSQSGELDEGAVVSWPQLVASATAVPQHLLAQSAGPATRGRGGTTCRRCMQVRACSRHGGHGHGPASRKQRSVE